MLDSLSLSSTKIKLVSEVLQKKTKNRNENTLRNYLNAIDQAFDAFLINNSVHILIKNYAHNL